MKISKSKRQWWGTYPNAIMTEDGHQRFFHLDIPTLSAEELRAERTIVALRVGGDPWWAERLERLDRARNGGGVAPQIETPFGDGKNSVYYPGYMNIVPAERIIPAQTALTWQTAREFASETPAEVPWVVKGLLAQGSITELDGRIKAAGKTTFLLHMARAVLDGLPFLGLETTKSPVVFLTEQADTSFREALERAGLSKRDDFILLPRHKATGTPWGSVVEQARMECKRRGAKVLFVDTLPQWAGLEGDSENQSGAALAVMRPLQDAAASDGLGILTTRHERKSGGEVGESARGSSAFGGAVDIILSLRRPEGAASPNMRVLHGLSRFADTLDTLIIQLEKDGYQSLGTEAAVAVKQAKEKILDSAPQLESEAIAERELLSRAEVKRSSGQEALRILLGTGEIQRTGDGKKGSPYRYWGPEMLSAGTHTLGFEQQTESWN